MKDPKRYDMEQADEQSKPEMVSNTYGDWVRYEEWAEVNKALQVLIIASRDAQEILTRAEPND